VGSLYCQPTDLPQGLNSVALSTIPLTDQAAACTTASSMLDNFFRGRWPLPLLSWGPDVTIRAVHIAVKLALDARGSSLLAHGDDSIERNYEAAVAWGVRVQKGTEHPDVTYSQPATQFVIPRVSSPNKVRGW
jgi:phage gp36-like protein